MRSMKYDEFLTAADPDILAGTSLETAPGRGVYIIRAASTVNTATLAVNGVRSPEVSPPVAVTLRASGEARAEDDPWVVPVTAGEKVIAALAGTTGTVGFHCLYVGR